VTASIAETKRKFYFYMQAEITDSAAEPPAFGYNGLRRLSWANRDFGAGSLQTGLICSQWSDEGGKPRRGIYLRLKLFLPLLSFLSRRWPLTATQGRYARL
jgi:hypothetical protein